MSSYTQDIQSKSFSLEQPNSKVQAAGKSNGRIFTPASHNNNKALGGGGVSLTTIMLIIGIILWAVGSVNCDPGMMLAGQILFGISVAPLAIVLVVCCCACACGVCGGNRSSSNFNPMNFDRT